MLNKIENSAFASINSSLGWIGATASSLCSLYASNLQQKAPDTKISNLVEQVHILEKIRRLGTATSYQRPAEKSEIELSTLFFADASRTDDVGHLGVLTRLLNSEMKNKAIYHAISWIFHKAKSL